MKEQLAKIRAAALEAIADSNAAAALDSVRVKYLGKKGELTSVLKQMGKLSAEERPVIGQIANEVRETLTKAIADQQSKLAEKALEAKLASETLDVSIPGIKTQLGHRHPVNQVIDMVTEIFLGMGFTRAEGPEVELADYNFTRLNTDEGHPAREWSDTFYLREDSSLHQRQHRAAHPDFPHADPCHGEPQAPHPHRRPRPCVPEGRGGRHPLPHVPSDRGHGGG